MAETRLREIEQQIAHSQANRVTTKGANWTVTDVDPRLVELVAEVRRLHDSLYVIGFGAWVADAKTSFRMSRYAASAIGMAEVWGPPVESSVRPGSPPAEGAE